MRKELFAVQMGILSAFVVLLALYVVVVGVANLGVSDALILLSIGMAGVSLAIITSVYTRAGGGGDEGDEGASRTDSDAARPNS